MTSDIDFMRALEEEYRQASGLKNRSEYKIFYGQVFPAPVLTLGLNPGGTPEETSEDGTRQRNGSAASSSASFFEGMENDVLDCDWRENTGLRKLLLPLVGGDQDRFRRDIIKTNIAFRRSRAVRDIDMPAAEREAVPFVERIMTRVNPKLIVLTGVKIDGFLALYARDSRPLAKTIRAPGINHVVFASAAIKMGLSEHETVVVQVAHASQFAWTYERYGVSERIAALMGSHAGQGRDTVSGLRSTGAPSPTARSRNAMNQPGQNLRVATNSVGDLRLAELETKWHALRISDQFHKVHHFADPKFSGKRERLENFIDYCSGREIRTENIRTLERALEVARLVQGGTDLSTSLKEAWSRFPTATR